MDEVQEEVLVMYQEAKSLSRDALPYVLKKELEMVGMLEEVIQLVVDNGELDMTPQQVKMLAHNIVIQGQMWGFRRWTIQKQFNLEEYIRIQTDWIFEGLKGYIAE